MDLIGSSKILKIDIFISRQWIVKIMFWRSLRVFGHENWMSFYCPEKNRGYEISTVEAVSIKSRNSTLAKTSLLSPIYFFLNRYRRKRPKVDASIFDSVLSHTRRSDASEKEKKKYSRPLLDFFACGQVSSPRLYRLRLSRFFELK